MKLQIINILVPATGNTVVVETKTLAGYKYIKGYYLAADFDTCKSYIGLKINDVEILPDNFSADIIKNDIAHGISTKKQKCLIPVEKSPVKITYKDTGATYRYPVILKLILELYEE